MRAMWTFWPQRLCPTCPARQSKYNRCGRLGHFGRKCRTNLKRQHFQSRSTNQDETCSYTKKPKTEDCFKINCDEQEKWIKCKIGGADIFIPVTRRVKGILDSSESIKQAEGSVSDPIKYIYSSVRLSG